MKKLLLLPLLLLMFASCEKKQDWVVITTMTTEQWNTISVTKIRTVVSSTEEIVLDMSEKEIKAYCKPVYYTEQYGTILYKFFNEKTYRAQ